MPRVDVFITCAGEKVPVILDTVRAAAGVDWLRDRLRIVVLDDKNSEEVRRQVKLLALDNTSIHYTAREKIAGVPHHFKAGNLIHGLRFVEDLSEGKADYVAALDADMIVEPQWLRALLPHLINDPAMALICPPQVGQNQILHSWPRTSVCVVSTILTDHHSRSIMCPRTIHSIKIWLSSSAVWNAQRMLLDQLGVQALAMLFADQPWMGLVASLLGPSPKMFSARAC